MIQKNRFKLAAALAACAIVAAASTAQADYLTFTLDSAQSYVTLNLPNFSYEGNTIDLRGVNRTNGAPTNTAWSASTNTGNTAFVTGTINTAFGGSLGGQTLSSIEFIAGGANLSALKAGNYRPNPAAYNSTTAAFNNNTPNSTDANYSAVPHVILGNAGIVAFSNTTYDISSGVQAASNTVGSGTIVTNTGINAGILDSTFSVQGLSIFLVGYILPNSVDPSLGSLLAPTTAAGGTYQYTSPTNLRLTVPLNVPFAIDLGDGIFLNGTAFGRFVANAAVPEPATIALAGFGLLSLVAVVRRQRRK